MIRLTGALNLPSFHEEGIRQTTTLNGFKDPGNYTSETPTVPKQNKFISGLNKFAQGLTKVVNTGLNIYQTVEAIKTTTPKISPTVPAQTLIYKEVQPLSSGEKITRGENKIILPPSLFKIFEQQTSEAATQPTHTVLAKPSSIDTEGIVTIAAVIGVLGILLKGSK